MVALCGEVGKTIKQWPHPFSITVLDDVQLGGRRRRSAGKTGGFLWRHTSILRYACWAYRHGVAILLTYTIRTIYLVLYVPTFALIKEINILCTRRRTWKQIASCASINLSLRKAHSMTKRTLRCLSLNQWKFLCSSQINRQLYNTYNKGTYIPVQMRRFDSDVMKDSEPLWNNESTKPFYQSVSENLIQRKCEFIASKQI